MAFNEKEQSIINWGLQNGKTKDQVSQALTNFRIGYTSPKTTTDQEPSYLSRVGSQMKNQFNEGVQSETASMEGKLNPLAAGANLFKNATGIAAAPLMQAPGFKQISEASSKVGQAISDTPLGNKVTDIMSKVPGIGAIADTAEGAGNVFALEGTGRGVKEGVDLVKDTTKDIKLPTNPDGGGGGIINNLKSVADKTTAAVKGSLEGRDTKLLSIFSGESTDAVNAALKNPEVADIGIQNGDAALRKVVQTGAESSIKARSAFTQAYRNAFKTIADKLPGKLVSRQKILYQFADDLENAGVKIKNGELDFSTSKIVANPGEVAKINNAYKAIQNWKDFSLTGVNELKQMVGQLTKFANEAGGSSKSPFLGKYYNYLDNTIKSSLPKEARMKYSNMNEKFSDNIGLYNDMVDAFNSGDPFTRLAQLFSSNKDSLRQLIDFYEKTTGNQVSPIVAGRTLAQEKSAAFGFLNPRSWLDFFIQPKIQAKVITGYGRLKNEAQSRFPNAFQNEMSAENTAPINNGMPTPSPKNMSKTNTISKESTTPYDKMSSEQIIEEKGGWKHGMKEKFDRALLNGDKATVKKMLSDVPKEYKEAFSEKINKVLNKKIPTNRGFVKNPFTGSEINDSVSKELSNLDTKPLTINGKPDLTDSDTMFRLGQLKDIVEKRALTDAEAKEAIPLLKNIGIDVKK